jgi:protein-tyrosine phosphatase
MDITWITDQIALGGGIWNEEKMEKVAHLGVTHIIDMQIEFDDTPLAEPYDVKVLWLAVDDDFLPKPPRIFELGVGFAQEALQENETNKVFIHCAAGVHRAPMMTLAILRVLGWSLKDARNMILQRRYVVDFADVYVESVENFIKVYEAASANPK